MDKDETISVSAAEFHRNFEVYEDMAQTRAVAITDNGEERAVLISAAEFHRLKRRDRKAMSVWELTEEQVHAIQRSEVPGEFASLDQEISDWSP